MGIRCRWVDGGWGGRVVVGRAGRGGGGGGGTRYGLDGNGYM